MWDEIIKMAVGNGLWAVLFCSLLAYLLRDSRMRESKYQATISTLCDRLSVLENVREDVSETLKIVKVKKKLDRKVVAIAPPEPCTDKSASGGNTL